MAFDLKSAKIVIVSWENQYAAAGGIRAVTQEYAKHLIEQDRQSIVVTPLHTGLKSPPGPMKPVATLWHDFDDKRHRVRLYLSKWETVPWIYLDSYDFFNADGGRDKSNPYLYQFDAKQEEKGNGSPELVKDCLFFAAIMPGVLGALNLKKNLVIHLQDWETCAVALTIKDAIERREIRDMVSSLALHNPYDSNMAPKALDKDGWDLISQRKKPGTGDTLGKRKYPDKEYSTFLWRILPYIDAPPTTVSREFAIDLTQDDLQSRHLADHLQYYFNEYGITGIDNGPFGNFKRPFTEKAVKDARAGKPDLIIDQKSNLRKKMVKMMSSYRPEDQWGNIEYKNLSPEKSNAPVFMCVGRLDEGQKGYDVLTRAIELLLKDNFDGYFILTPIVGNAPQPYIDDLEQLGKNQDHDGRVVIYPIRMKKGYIEIQAGSSFSLWPSMYEPFGAVSEFLLRGTPVIARSTGGLRQQIINFQKSTGKGNGIVYKTISPEPDDNHPSDVEGEENEWRLIQREKYPQERMKYPVYEDQVNQLFTAIKRSKELLDSTKLYGQLLSNLYDSVSDYSWNRAEKEYFENYAKGVENL